MNDTQRRKGLGLVLRYTGLMVLGVTICWNVPFSSAFVHNSGRRGFSCLCRTLVTPRVGIHLSSSVQADETIILQPSPEDANIELHRLVQAHDNKTLVLLDGYISKRRALGSSLAFFDLVVTGSNETTSPVQVLMRKDFYAWGVRDPAASTKGFKAYFKAVQPGTHVRFVGHAGPSRNPGEALLFVHETQFITPNRNPQHLKNVLWNIQNGNFPLDEFSRALCIDPDELLKRVTTTDHMMLAKQILSNFPANTLLDPAKLMGSSNDAKIKLLPPVPKELKFPPEWLKATVSGEHDKDGADVVDPISVATLTNAYSTPNVSEKPVTVLAWVRNRRRFQYSTTVLEVVDDFAPVQDNRGNDSGEFVSDWTRLKCILHPEIMKAHTVDTANLSAVDMYGTLLCAGSRVLLQGFVTKDVNNVSGTNDPLNNLWITNARVVRSSWRPKVVRHMLELLATGDIDMAEATAALELPGGYNEAEVIAREMQLTERQWKAAEISKRLQDSNSLVGVVTPHMQRVLDNSQKWRETYPVSDESQSRINDENVELGTNNQRPLRTSAPGSKWQRTKLPQLEWMMAQIKRVIDCHPGPRPLTVADVGGGKGNLATYIAEQFGNDVHVRVIDISARSLNNGLMRSRRRNVNNVQFDKGDASTVDMAGVDLVVALHACGVLSDVAIGHAVSQGAAFVVCPCCFRSNPHLRVTHTTGSPTTTSLVPASDWLGIDPTDLDSLTKIAELQGDINLAGKAIHAICALRAKAAQRRFIPKGKGDLTVSIKTFPISLSTRNYCIIGEVRNDDRRL